MSFPSPVPATPGDPPPGWRALLSTATAGQESRLALGVELRHRESRAANPWGPRPMRPATARDVARNEGEVHLGIRPLMRSDATGAWVHGSVSWDSVRRPTSEFGRESTRWFADLLSIARDTLLSGTAGDWLLVDHIDSGLLWAHLRAGAAIGIPLVATQKGSSVSLADACEITAQVARGDDGGLIVTPEVTVDGRLIEPAGVRTIGRGGVYAVTVAGARMSVTLAEVALGEPVHALLNAPGPLRVPAAEEPAFLRDAYPLLARRMTVRAARDVRLPELPAPRAVLVLSFHRGDTVKYAFEWEYRGFGRVPFDASGDAVRDDAAEHEQRRALEAVWREKT
ncbi:MAG TPA: DNA/RNA helicase, partial [Microbacterium sp.]|nr:DNA/RNA helicase [Microbacterium sp.]